MDFENRIEITPAIRSGKPCIKGTRIAVYDVLEYLAGGMTQAQLLDENLSRRLMPMPTLAYPDSQHVSQAGLQGQADSTIWRHAAQQGSIIV